MDSTKTAISPIAEALFPGARRRVLALLFGRPDESFFLREIARRTGLSVGQVQHEVRKLGQCGIIQRTQRGNHVFFQANADCPVFQELRQLIIKTAGAADILRDALMGLESRIIAAFIYGSVAAGEQKRASDLDLMVIGDVTFAEVVAAVRPAEQTLARSINANVYTLAEFAEKHREDNHFLATVMRQDKVFVIGAEDEFRNLLEQQVDS